MPKKSVIYASYWMAIALFSASLMAVSIKELSVHLGTSEILFFRSFISLIIVTLIITVTDRKQFRTNNLKTHLLRNIAHFMGQYGWVYGIAFIPLAEVFALEFTVPIWTAIIATLLLKEQLTKVRIISIVLGFIGVWIILRPTSEIIHPASFAVLGAAISYGLAHTLTKSLIQNNSPLTIVFYMALLQLPMGLIPSLNEWVSPSGFMWFWITLVGITSLGIHYSMAKALTLADVIVVVPMEFLRLPLIMVVGFIFYNETVEWFLLAGALVMLFGNFLNLKSERK